ncbi:MAG: heavy metal transporter [Flavobacteriaceae bacterium]|nr:heavy metal transporter [Flavobacteriaceae bacterium]
MNQKFLISGMTCLKCKASIENALQSFEAITTLKVDFKKQELSIISNEGLTLSTVQKLIPKKYTILEKDFNEKSIDKEFEGKSKIQQLKPLFLIIFYITSASLLLNFKNWNLNEFMLDFMGLFFIVFSFFKMLDLNGFLQSFKMYDPLAKRVSFYGRIYPFIETLLGLMFLMRYEINIALIITLVLLVITTIGVSKVLLQKQSIQCACLGTVLKLPMTEATLIENSIMIVMAIVMIIG